MSAAVNVPSSVGPAGSFVHRAITVVIRLGRGRFNESGTDTVTLAGLCCSAAITKAGSDTQGELDLRVYGMTDSLMRQVAQLAGTPEAVDRNDQVTVLAGDTTHGMAVAYIGVIRDAWVDYSDLPGISLHIVGMAALADALRPVPPTSYWGGADVVAIMAGLAATMGKSFENSGVAGIVLHNPYFPGTAYEQFERCRQAARINGTIDDGVLAIWPLNGSRGGAVPLISPDTGMVGYPMRTQNGVTLQCLYNPAVIIGGRIKVETSNTPAAGTWNVNHLAHVLKSETQGGQWFTSLTAVTPGVT